jgi:hypothetical protein
MPGPSGQMGKTRLNSQQIAKRNIDIWQARIDGMNQMQIAVRYGISQSAVHKILTDMVRVRSEPVAAELRQLEMDKLDQAEASVLEVLRRKHVHIQGGRIVKNDDDEEMEDDAHVLAAVDRLVKISARRSALLGLDAPQKIEQMSYSYTVNGISVEDLR